jgi:hypothetical protein
VLNINQSFFSFSFYWDLIMLILLITNVIVLPVAIAFFSEEINSARWIIFNIISDAFFLFDIVVNFRTGFFLFFFSFIYFYLKRCITK